MAEELELAWVREALQTRLLVELMSNAMHKELVLKGGMAMRAVHGSVRYTKDIDLDADERASKEWIQGVVRRSIERAVSSGLIAMRRSLPLNRPTPLCAGRSQELSRTAQHRCT